MPESEFMVCRICLTEATDSMTALFGEPENTQSRELVRKIEEIGSVKMLPLDDIPSMLCLNCMDTLTTAYKFREQIQESERSFARNCVKAEFKLEPSEIQMDGNRFGHAVEFVYETANEFIDADEDIELGMMEERLEDEIEEEDHIAQYEDDDEDEFVTTTKPIHLDPDEILIKSSESEYDPSERVRKPKVRKTRHGKRGRPRTKPKPAADDETTTKKHSAEKTHEETPQTNIMCEICGNIYAKRGALNIHMRRHMSEKPFECEICRKTFAGPSELNRHIRVHTGEKPFTCKYCSRSFSDRSSNIRHERTHTNERPFSCTTCGKSFSYSNVLKNHMLTHTGEKPFLCLPCNKTFSRKHQLEQHIGTLTHQQTARARQVPEQTIF